MKKNTLLLFVAILFAFNTNAQMVMGSETFDGTVFPPTGWLVKPDSTPSQNIWRRITSGTFPICNTKGGAAMARFSSRNYIAGAKQLLISRQIDYSNRTVADAANINFWMYRDTFNTNYDSVTVWVNDTDTLNANALKLGTIARYRGYAIPDTQVNNGWRYYSFAVPNTYISSTSTRFIFEGTSGSIIAGQGAHQFIDQLTFEEYPTACTGTPNMGNIIVSTPIICGGSGSSNLSLSSPSLATGLLYNWISATSPFGPYTSLGSAATVNTGTISASLYVTCIVTCSNSGLSDTTNIDSIFVSTNPLPMLTTSPTPAVFCAGTAGATITASGATSYNWAPVASLNIPTGATVIASPMANTTYTIIGFDAIGCSDTTTVNVILNNGPTLQMTATPNDSLCIGAPVILNCIGGNGGNTNTYLWSDGTTTRRDTIIVSTSKYYAVMVTNVGGCISKDSIFITALPPQVSGFTYIQVGNTFSFTDTTINPKSWSWSFGDGNSSNLKNPVYTYSAPGTYTITLIVNGPCKRDTISKVISIFPLLLSSSNNGIQAVCYPNPASDVLQIRADNDAIQTAIITNLVGQQLALFKSKGGNTLTTLPIASLPKGIYNLHLKGSKGNAILKFVKQ